MRGRKNKYEDCVLPRLKEVEDWASAGATEKEISEALGISVSTLNEYKNKYSELSESLHAGRQKVCIKIKAALLKKALGFEYEEKRGVRKNGEIVSTEVFVRYCPPDTTAAAMLLRNYDSEWRDKDIISTEIKKQEVELKKAIAEASNWIDFEGNEK